MMSKKKGILNAVFLITVFAITIYAIFHGQDLGELFGYIRNTDYRCWLVAVVCVVFFICSESCLLYTSETAVPPWAMRLQLEPEELEQNA